MSVKPIIFSAPMVRALLDGRKTQTRRVLKPQPSSADENGLWYRTPSGGESLNCHDLPCAPGDLLWCRETWSGEHMLRWTSRLTLEVTDVRIQRVQDISEEDAVCEGVERDTETGFYWGADGQGVGGATRLYAAARNAYRDIWDSLNAARGYGWEVNPWVVALTFRVHHQNVDDLLRQRETCGGAGHRYHVSL